MTQPLSTSKLDVNDYVGRQDMGLLDKVKEALSKPKQSGQAQPGADQPGGTQDTGQGTPGGMPDGGADTGEPPAGGDAGV